MSRVAVLPLRTLDLQGAGMALLLVVLGLIGLIVIRDPLPAGPF